MDREAILTGMKLRGKPDYDWLSYENQTGEWSVRSCEAFERHLKAIKLTKDWKLQHRENLWYGYPSRRMFNG